MTNTNDIILPFNDGSPGWRGEPVRPVRVAVQPPERLDVGHAFEVPPEPLDFVLPGMKAGSVGSIVAAGATGKSMMAVQLAVALAGGKDTLELGKAGADWTPGCGEVLYLSGEDPADILSGRLHSIGAHLDAEQRERVAQHLHIWPLSGIGARLDDYEWRKAIEEGAADKRLVILDTLRRFHEKDENDGGEMSAIISMMEKICLATGASFLFLHHTSKASALGGTAGEQQASRGSSVLTDNVRWQSNLSTMSEKEAAKAGITDERRRYVRMSFPKINYSAPIGDRWFVRGKGGVLLPAPQAVADLVAGSITKGQAGCGGGGGRKAKGNAAAAPAVAGGDGGDGGDVPMDATPMTRLPGPDDDIMRRKGAAGRTYARNDF